MSSSEPVPSTIVFDFDGTLVDSLKVKYETRFELFAHESEEIRLIAAEVIPKMRGKLRGEIFRSILAKTHVGLTPEQLEAKALEYVDRYDDLVEQRIIEQGLFPGTRAAIEKLGQTHALYINSGTPQYALTRLIQRLDLEHVFLGVYGIDPTRLESSAVLKQENLRTIIKHAKAESDKVLVVGDGVEDIDSAEACGCQFVGIRSERSAWSEQRSVLMLQNVAEILSLPFFKN